MPIILRGRATLPILEEDGTSNDVEFATIAFCHENGQQYSQINCAAALVGGISDGAYLALAEGDEALIILVERVTHPVEQEDGSFTDEEFATIGFYNDDGDKLSQLDIEASEVEGIASGSYLAFTEGDDLGLAVPADRSLMMMRGDLA